jgi:hypothetical protein
MGNYNAIAGISEENLNRLTVQVYENLYKSSTLFKDTRIFDKLLLYSVSYDVTAAPVFTLAPSSEAMEKLMEAVNGLTEDHESLPEFRKFIEESAVTFSVDVPSVKLSVVLIKGKAPIIDLKASITAGCSVEINNEGKVIPCVVSAKIKLPGYEPIEEVLNAIALPVIIELVNKFVSKGFTLPLIKLAGAEFSHPLARIENKTLVTYAALKNTGPTLLPDQYTWPRNKTFAYFDKNIAESAAAAALVNTQKSGTAGVDLAGLKLTASYIGGIKDPIFEFKEGVETSNTFTAYGGGKLSAKYLIFPTVTASFTVSATPTASSILQLSGGQLFYTLQHINDFKVYIDIDLSVLPLPDFIKKIINDSLSFILKPFAQLFGEILHGLTVKICNIKPIEFEISGVKMAISLADNTIATITGPDNKKLVCVEGILGVAHPD